MNSTGNVEIGSLNIKSFSQEQKVCTEVCIIESPSSTESSTTGITPSYESTVTQIQLEKIHEDSPTEASNMVKQTQIESHEKSTGTIIRATKFISNISKTTLRSVKIPPKRKDSLPTPTKNSKGMNGSTNGETKRVRSAGNQTNLRPVSAITRIGSFSGKHNRTSNMQDRANKAKKSKIIINSIECRPSSANSEFNFQSKLSFSTLATAVRPKSACSFNPVINVNGVQFVDKVCCQDHNRQQAIKKSSSVPNLSSVNQQPPNPKDNKDSKNGIKEKFLSPLTNTKLIKKEPKGVTASRIDELSLAILKLSQERCSLANEMAKLRTLSFNDFSLKSNESKDKNDKEDSNKTKAKVNAKANGKAEVKVEAKVNGKGDVKVDIKEDAAMIKNKINGKAVDNKPLIKETIIAKDSISLAKEAIKDKEKAEISTNQESTAEQKVANV